MHFGGKYHLLYAEKDNRDRRYDDLRKNGVQATRSRVLNQQLHPMYVEDRRDTEVGRQTGIGNEAYKTLFSVLYTLDWEA
jgi:hypothetical protein